MEEGDGDGGGVQGEERGKVDGVGGVVVVGDGGGVGGEGVDVAFFFSPVMKLEHLYIVEIVGYTNRSLLPSTSSHPRPIFGSHQICRGFRHPGGSRTSLSQQD